MLPTPLTLLSPGSAVILIALVANRVLFPFHIDLMEGVVMQHPRRAMYGQSIYPLPSPEFVALAYNTLFYMLAAPLLLLIGDTLSTLRMASVTGPVGSAMTIFVIVRSTTRSPWWGASAVGIFCAIYAAMDAYLDHTHAHAWLFCCAPWGTHLVRRVSRGPRIAGILVHVAAFWFKQHRAALFAAAPLFLRWREDVRKACPCWLIAIALGLLLHLVPPRTAPRTGFQYFTWHVPSGWSHFATHRIYRVVPYAVPLVPRRSSLRGQSPVDAFWNDRPLAITVLMWGILCAYLLRQP